nr:DHA2 family efflux MFS transporter permease subunit [Hongsoonwoonella zoysiae]
MVALVVACALFMQTLDSTILGTALPAIGKSFSIDPVRLHLAMTSYLIALAVFMPVSGWIADRFGTRNVFRWAVAIFVLASVGCGAASSVAELIFMRVVQGVGGALMVPVARLALLRAVPKSQLVQAMTWVTVPALIGPVVGPPLGGFLVTYAEWPWIFWINVPVGLLGVGLATLYFEDIRGKEKPPFDLKGFCLSAVAISGLLFGSELVPNTHIAGHTGHFLVAIGLLSGIAYVQHANTASAPILDLSLLRIPTFRVSLFGGSFFRFGIGAIPFLLPLMLQQGFGKSAINSGLITFAAAAGAISMKFAAPRILARAGFRNVLSLNALLAAISIAACAAFSPQTPAALMIAVLFIGGFFRSLQFTALNSIAFADLDDAEMSRATGFTSMAQQLSLSIGVSLAALTLSAASMIRGNEGAGPQDYAIAFLVIAGIVLLSAISFLTLDRGAGASVSGHAATVGGASRPPSDTRA